ncbi:MAG: DUF4366 domain-containing protein [Lachnospiraceae bacterium]
MKNKIWMRMFSVLFSALIMMGGFSMTAYAGGGDETEDAPEETATTETENTQEPVALTPEGNLTLVDDIEGEASGDKQFITVITRNGNYFYIIIDRAEDGENTVHFLNQVDEADLMSLIEDGEFEVQTSVVTPEPEPVSTTEPEPEPKPEENNGGIGGIVAVILILALGGGGAFYYFKVMKPKQSVKGGDNLDDFDFEDDEEMELEVFEDDEESAE